VALLQKDCGVPIRLVFHNGKPGFADLVADLAADGAARNVLVVPMMLFGGRHLQKDLMAAEGSLSAMLQEAGHAVTVAAKGLGEYRSVRELLYEGLMGE
jgi:cobalamin biosynthesis Co2+ chelatase CbiK